MSTQAKPWKLITMITSAQVAAMGLMIFAAAAVTPEDSTLVVEEQVQHEHGNHCDENDRTAWMELGLFSR